MLREEKREPVDPEMDREAEEDPVITEREGERADQESENEEAAADFQP